MDDAGHRLRAHLESWLGVWPPPTPDGLTVVESHRRVDPGWDGSTRPLAGVAAPELGTVLSVPPGTAAAVRALGDDLDDIAAALPVVLHRPERKVGRGVFRWCPAPPTAHDLPDAGEWVDPRDERVPPWLRPFNGEVLVAWDDEGRYGAGVGRKRHDRHGQELSVGTEPALRNHGIARRLVAQAARRVHDEGAVATYLHAVDNVASGRVADAAGFPDRGWQVIGLPTAT